MVVSVNLLSGAVPLNLILFAILTISIAEYVRIKYIKIEETDEVNNAFSYLILIIGIYFVVYGMISLINMDSTVSTISYSTTSNLDQAMIVPTTIMGILAVIIAVVKIKSNDTMENSFIGIPAFLVGMYGVFYSAGMLSYSSQNSLILILLEAVFLVGGVAGMLSMVLIAKKRKGMAILIFVLLIITAIISVFIGMYSVYLGSGYIWHTSPFPSPLQVL